MLMMQQNVVVVEKKTNPTIEQGTKRLVSNVRGCDWLLNA